MLIENSFPVAAEPDQVFDFLQDAHNVAACFPGAELLDEVGDDTYLGRVKIKVGPVTATYAGTATIVSRDPATRTAVLRAEGKDSRGAGSANATAHMHVEPAEVGATVQFATELAVSGKLAQFGRGIMSDVSARMVAQLADAVRDRIQTTAPQPEPGPATDPGSETAAPQRIQSTAPTPAPHPGRTAEPAATSHPAPAPAALRAGPLIRAVIAGFFRRLFARLRSSS
jgi:hypothetical protein